MVRRYDGTGAEVPGGTCEGGWVGFKTAKVSGRKGEADDKRRTEATGLVESGCSVREQAHERDERGSRPKSQGSIGLVVE